RHDANQSRHMLKRIAVGSNKPMATIATVAATTAPIALDIRKPSTWRTSSSLKTSPNQRLISQAVIRGWAALARLKGRASQGLLPIMRLHSIRLHAIVAVTTAAVTGKRAGDPSVIRTPVASPAAGENTANPSGASRRAIPSLDARK